MSAGSKIPDSSSSFDIFKSNQSNRIEPNRIESKSKHKCRDEKKQAEKNRGIYFVKKSTQLKNGNILPAVTS